MGGRTLLVVSVVVGLALTPVDIIVQWKISCQLMEELPVAAGRSVATGAMCVNLFPCHFFCLSAHPLSTFISTFFPFSFHLCSPRLHSLYLQTSMTNYSWRLICWLSKVLLVPAMKVGRAGVEGASPPPPLPAFLPVVITCPLPPPPSHIRSRYNSV